MTITIMEAETPLYEINKDGIKVTSKRLYTNARKSSQLKTKDLAPDKITIHTLTEFLETRCPSKHRRDLPKWLKIYGLREYNPYLICQVTHGICYGDLLWMKFDDEKVVYDDVRLK